LNLVTVGRDVLTDEGFQLGSVVLELTDFLFDNLFLQATASTFSL